MKMEIKKVKIMIKNNKRNKGTSNNTDENMSKMNINCDVGINGNHIESNEK